MNFILKKKFFIYPSILLFIAFNNLSLFKLNSSQLNIEKKLTVEFFDQLPPNDYIIGPGDSLNIIISRELELSTQADLDGEGTIYLPKLGRIYVNGLTINELNFLLDEAYKKFINFPQVETKITNYRPIKVFVKGEVVNPGLQSMPGSLMIKDNDRGRNNFDIFSEKRVPSFENINYFFPTVFDAIRASGGITQFSDLRNIEIIRTDNISNGSGQKKAILNFDNLLRLGENSQNIRIYDNDIILVKKNTEANKNLLTKAILSNLNPRFIKVFVSGRVNRPGSQTVSRASVMSDAIDMAGGAKLMRGPVTFIRFNPDGSIDKRRVSLTSNKRGKYNNPTLRDGDLIIVGNNLLTSTNEVIQEFTSPFVGIFSTYGLIKAIYD